MELSVPLQDGLSLAIADQAAGGATGGESDTAGVGANGGASERADVGTSVGEAYPTARLQKGLLLRHGSHELAEEGVGFGVPILKLGIRTVFPGGVDLAWRRQGPVWEIAAAFEMNLVERLAKPGVGNLKSGSLYAAKNALAALHRRCPPLRGLLTATSNAMRRRFGWVTTFQDAGSSTTLKVTYVIDGEEGRVGVAVDMTDLPDGITEVVVMNEQGARQFDRYVDADGTSLQGSEVGTWDRVAAEWAGFVGITHGVAFSLEQVAGARLHRGRELIGSRVAWSGFGYSIPPTMKSFGYDLRIDSIP